MPDNTPSAKCKGFEIDIRKRLSEFENLNYPFSFLKDLTFVANTSIIKSEILTNQSNARDSIRSMEGQSPYIINLGLYYDNLKSGTKVNLSYNKIGKRIVYAGTRSNPHTWELPRNSVDININQKIGKRTEINFSIKDLLNEKSRFVQYYGKNDSVELPTQVYRPNRKFSLGLSVTL
jgi:outer membrane receptor protein involved in Fe transport